LSSVSDLTPYAIKRATYSACPTTTVYEIGIFRNLSPTLISRLLLSAYAKYFGRLSVTTICSTIISPFLPSPFSPFSPFFNFTASVTVSSNPYSSNSGLRQSHIVVGEGGVAARTTTAGQGNEARQGARNNQTTKQPNKKIQARQRGPITDSMPL
jgi:hypothetical protein